MILLGVILYWRCQDLHSDIKKKYCGTLKYTVRCTFEEFKNSTPKVYFVTLLIILLDLTIIMSYSSVVQKTQMVMDNGSQ